MDRGGQDLLDWGSEVVYASRPENGWEEGVVIKAGDWGVCGDGAQEGC